MFNNNIKMTTNNSIQNKTVPLEPLLQENPDRFVLFPINFFFIFFSLN